MKENLRIPSYRRHASGQGIVSILGRDFYLGLYGSDESKSRYRRLIAEYIATGRIVSESRDEPDEGPTVAELMVRYVEHAQVYYRQPSGAISNQVTMIRLSLRTLRRLYSDTPAREFGPLRLKVVRDAFIKEGLARSEVNRRVGLIKQFFVWAVGEELIPPDQIEALKCVTGLKAGRTSARETAPVEPVPDDVIDRTITHLPRVVAAMVEFQRWTGARPQEVTAITAGAIDRSADVWEYRPAHHKNSHRGKQRIIPIGPRGQAVIEPWLRPDAPGSPLFSPQDRMADLSTERRAARRSPLTPSQRARKPRPDRSRPPGDSYTTGSYRRAIHRACDAAGIERWSPNQIRHTFATRLRSEAGLDAASTILGHASPDTTLIYAERDMDAARSAMAKFG